MKEFEILLKDINAHYNTYFFNPELIDIIKKLQSPDVMSEIGKDQIINIYEKYKNTNMNDIASIIYLNDNIDKDIIDKIIDTEQHPNTLMLALGRNNINEDTARRIIGWLDKPYVIDRVDDFEFLMENTNSPFTFKDCPLSKTVINMLRPESKDWHFIFEKYTNDDEVAQNIINNDASENGRIVAIAYNGNLSDSVRNNAFDIAYNPSKLYKFATPYMVDILYESAVETLFEMDTKTPKYEEITNYSEGIIHGLIGANKLTENHIMDFVQRFINHPNTKCISILSKVAEKSQSKDVLKKILSIPNIKKSSIEQTVFLNKNTDYVSYENHISEQIKQVLDWQTQKGRTININSILENITDCYENRHCFIPHPLVKAIEDDGFRYTCLMHYDSVATLKENVYKTELDKSVAEFFDEIMKNIKDQPSRDVISELFKKSLYNTFMRNNAPKPLRDGTTLNLLSWSTWITLTKRRSGISTESANKVLDVVKKFEKELPKPLIKNFKTELENRCKMTAPKFEINKILQTNFLNTNTFNFNFYEINLKSLKDIVYKNPDEIKEKLKNINIEPKQLNEINEKIKKELNNLAGGRPEDRILFYETITNANLLYNTFKEMIQEKTSQRETIEYER